MIACERNLSFNHLDNYTSDRDSSIIIQEHGNQFYSLTGMHKAFVCTMIACSKENVYKQLSYLMKSTWFMSRKTYHKTRRELIDMHVIVKLEGKHRFVLNPDYHPSLDRSRIEMISYEVSLVYHRRCLELIKLRDLSQEP